VTGGSLYKITYTGNFAPVIYQHPQDALATAGDTVTFSVAVTGKLFKKIKSTSRNGLTVLFNAQDKHR
jgi:hypothetical protein